MFKEFKEFSLKGNVVDLAVGVIIGGAFGKIVSSLVSDIILPPLGFLTGGIDFSDKVFVLKVAEGGRDAITLNYGIFIDNILSFLIVAFAIFMLIRQMNRFRKEEPKKSEPTNEEKLLTEIRDLLKSQK